MITVQIGEETRTLEDASESWINEQINRRRRDGLPICVIVTLNRADAQVTLRSPGCGGGFGGGGGRPPNAKESHIIQLWERRRLNSEEFTGGNLVAFLKQIKRL